MIKEIIASAGVNAFAEAALVIFFVVFVSVLWKVMRGTDKKEFEQIANLPLDDEMVKQE